MVEWQDDERLADWVDGNMDARELERFDAELAVNPDLRRAADEYKAATERIRAALRDDTEPSAGLTDRIMLGLETTGRIRRMPWLGSLAAAAALVLVFFGVSRLGDVPEPEFDRTARFEVPESADVDSDSEAGVTSETSDVSTRVGKARSGGEGERVKKPGAAFGEDEDRFAGHAPSPARATSTAIEELGRSTDAPSESLPDDAARQLLLRLATEELAEGPSGAERFAPVVVIELPMEEVRARRAESGDERAPQTLDFLRAPIRGTKWRAGAPALRQALGPIAAAEDDFMLGARKKDSADTRPQEELSRSEPSVARDGDSKDRTIDDAEIFELRGTREQIGEYVRKLSDLARQNRGAVRTLEAESVAQAWKRASALRFQRVESELRSANEPELDAAAADNQRDAGIEQRVLILVRRRPAVTPAQRR